MIFFNFIVNGKAAELQDLSCLSDVSLRQIQYFLDVIFFYIFEGFSTKDID